ncbi:MAG: zinc ribbon domain-containing protein [Eubacteriales bacterium]|nr:zinc ribbon domain-containing protein [Eubacteriales bacterium]
MKCNSCGANYKLLDNACPYCGKENAIGMFWNGEIKTSLEKNEEVREDISRRIPVVTYTKVIHRILTLEIIVLLIWTIFLAPRMIGRIKSDTKDAFAIFNEKCMVIEDMNINGKYDDTYLYNDLADALTYGADILNDRDDYVDVLGWSIHVPHGEEYKNRVMDRLKYEFLLTDEEIENVKTQYIHSEFLPNMFSEIAARNGWEVTYD